MSITVGSTGQLIKGTVSDVSLKTLERLIKDIDSQLYIKWNPKKSKGQGMWELRRRPNEKRIKSTFKLEGQTYHILDYVEYDVENHIWDIPILGYNQLTKLRDADTWAHINYELGHQHRVEKFTEKMEDNFYQNKYKQKEDARKEAIYGLMQDKAQFKWLKDSIIDGINPNQLGQVWKK